MSSSRPYRLTVKETLQRTLVAEDHVETTLTIPPILPPEKTEGILRRVLKERGFEDNDPEEGRRMTRSNGGVNVSIDPSNGTVTVSASDSTEASESGEGNLPACSPCAERAREGVRESLRERLGRALDERERELVRGVTERLEGSLAELGCELERISNSVTSSAIKQKARELGEIKSITQDEETGAMTIVIEVN
jgi:hypothetical protein